MPRILLLLPTTTYRAPDFLDAAARLGVDVAVASEETSTLERLNPQGLLTLDFGDPKACARRVEEFARSAPIAAVVGVDEESSVVASEIARALGLAHNPPAAALAARHKPTMRRLLVEADVPSPMYRVFRLEEGAGASARKVRFPCVLKPTFLSGSRGVIRANAPEEFVAAWDRIEKILRDPILAARGKEWVSEILVEDFVSGSEVALEGLLSAGKLETLALFDKPDPLEGPFFEETIYVTPSRLSEDAQRQIREAAALGARALGLREGPIHAELRWNEAGPWLIEIAARSIGGLCSRALRFGTGLSLEELVLQHALGRPSASVRREPLAAGVMMIPIPSAGVLGQVHGLARAHAVPGIEEITITVRSGQTLVPLPEGSRYLGFLFSRGQTPEQAEAALRAAHRELVFEIVGS